MGAGQSITIDAATEAQKEKVGRFSLRSTQKEAVQSLEDLLAQLLVQNNLFDLAAILNKEESCSKLFMVLSSKVKDEFKSLRLPDPLHPSNPRSVHFIPKSMYTSLEKDPLRVALCDQIAWFIIRFVTVISALTASVSVGKQMPLLLSKAAAPSSGLVTMNPRYKNHTLQLSTRDPIPQSVMDALVAGAFRRVKLPNGSDDARPLYCVGNEDSVVIDAVQSIVYMPQGVNTGVMSIRIETHVDRTGLVQPVYRLTASQQGQMQGLPQGQMLQGLPQSQMQGLPQGQMLQGLPQSQMMQGLPQGLPQGQMMRQGPSSVNTNPAVMRPGAIFQGPGSVRSNASTAASFGGRRRTRRHRHSSRKQRGGASIYLVSLRSLVNCDASMATSTCPVVEFYMQTDGTTIDKNVYDGYQPGSGVLTGVPFVQRMRDLIGPESTKVQKVPLEEPRERGLSLSTKFSPLHVRDTQTLDRFKDIRDAIEGKPEGASPAAYRAFLLASAIEAGRLSTMFCTDMWADQRTTNTVAYSLLQSLYNNREEGDMDTQAANVCAKSVANFLGAKTMRPFVPAGGTPVNFDNIAFIRTPTEVSAFCKQVESSGERKTNVADHIKILTSAHKRLRDLYDGHLAAVVNVVKKMLYFTSAGYRQAPNMHLDDKFVNDSRGALVALEEIIVEARDLITKHYFDVEQVYIGAINQIGRLAAGNAPSVNVVEKRRGTLLTEFGRD